MDSKTAAEQLKKEDIPGSTASSVTHVYPAEKEQQHEYHAGGHGESALPEDKLEEEKENIEDDWEDDPENPRNWPIGKKWTAVFVVALYTFIPPLASSMMAPGLPEVAIRYGITNPTIIALTLSIFLLSFALAPLVLAPLSEMYGRTWVLHIANLFSIAFSFGCAYAPTTGALIGFRFLAGFSGSAPIAIGGGSVGDLFAEKDRATAMAVYSLGPLIGPVVGPIAGGFIAQTIGVKYVFVIIGGVSVLGAAIGIPLLKETYAPVIRLRRAMKSGDPEALKRIPNVEAFHGDKMKYLRENLTRPIIMLTRSFICFILSLYMAFLYGVYYLMFTTFASLFSDVYGFKPGVGGLAYIGLGIGFFTATIVGAKLGNKIYTQLAAKEGGKGRPEMRIPALGLGSIAAPIGLFWYGWTAQAHTHWILPIIGTGIYGFGLMMTFLPIQLYLVDAFQYAASAVSAAAVFRSLFGFAFPLFAQQMFDVMGIGGGNSFLGGLAIVLGIPFPIWIYYKGEKIRTSSKLKL